MNDMTKPEAAPTDLFSKFDPMIETRRSLLATGVTDPFSLVMEKVLSPTTAICNGRETILLGTYNYMGMTFDPEVIEPFNKNGLAIDETTSFAGDLEWDSLTVMDFVDRKSTRLNSSHT